MVMRGGSRRAGSGLAIAVRHFEWSTTQTATLRHSTLPWFDGFADSISLPASHLGDARELGKRDRLSLVGQFAAHQALLQFAGIADGEFSIDEWAIVAKRGSDCRLVRTSARASNVIDAPPVLTTIEQFAQAIDAPPLETFRRSWARAESMYAEVFDVVAADVAANSVWLRASATGEVLPPGSELLTEIASGSTCSLACDGHVLDALRALEKIDERLQVIAIRGGSVLQRYSALAELRRLVRDLDALNENEIVERLVPIAEARRIALVVDETTPLDPSSARIVQQASTIEQITTVRTSPRTAERAFFVVSTRLDARRNLEDRLRSTADPDAWLRAFTSGTHFTCWLANGDLAPADVSDIHLPEPRRSYVAALALLGTSVPLTVARRYLDQFLFTGDLADLAVEGMSEVNADEYRFVSDAMRSRITSLIPPASHAPLYRVAARAAQESGRHHDAARLLLASGDANGAVQIFSEMAWPSAEALVTDLRALPASALAASGDLTRRYVKALIDCGRYRDARAIAEHLPQEARDLALARIERQMGDYDAALQRLQRLAGDCAADLIRAEILMVQRKTVEAIALLRRCHPTEREDRERLGYELALVGEMSDEPVRDYYAARLDTYRAVESSDIDSALRAVARSLQFATTVIQRLDALLDRMYVLVTSGRWSEARAAALDGLTLAEETQGDRAAGGFLFVIAYLAADDGQWAHAEQRIDRLRRFYSGTHDERRTGELSLLSANLEFSRGRFADAAREAATILESQYDAQICEAAALIVDESHWILGNHESLVSTGKTPNVELTDRHRLMKMRRGDRRQQFVNPFIGELAAWELGGALPLPTSTTHKLMMFRSALGRHDRGLAEKLAQELGVQITRVSDAPRAEQAVLRAVSAQEFPFDERPLAGVHWRYVSRNRLRQWQQVGSLPTLTQDAIDGAEQDWIVVSDHERLFIDDSDTWSDEARDAIVALMTTKAELSRLRRIVEQEATAEPATVHDVASGIVGQSTAIRDLLALVARVAKRDVPICVLGESGTGKELVARAIHMQSSRRSRPFTAINCAALPENLIESELFGHVRGAFTGADRDRAGVIESTDGGTLFLDEIGEMALVAQAKLLRFLQDGEFRRVGDTSNRSADVRIVAATNRKLESAVEEGRFREDLYYRIRGLEAILPPLRDRGRDILLLASHFIAAERARHRTGPSRLSAEAEAIFLAYNWPGNVRELQNTIRAAHAIAGEAREVDVDHLPERLRRIIAPRATVSSYQEAVTRFRRDLIEKSLAEAMGNQNRAASMLNISRQALAYQIRELGIMVNKPERRLRSR